MVTKKQLDNSYINKLARVFSAQLKKYNCQIETDDKFQEPVYTAKDGVKKRFSNLNSLNIIIHPQDNLNGFDYKAILEELVMNHRFCFEVIEGENKADMYPIGINGGNSDNLAINIDKAFTEFKERFNEEPKALYAGFEKGDKYVFIKIQTTLGNKL